MALFERKYCDICGEKVGVFGGTKVKDGRLCKNCAGKLSPWFTGYGNLTLDEIKEHLAYREENKEKVKNFNITHVIGGNYQKLYIDAESKRFIISANSNWRNGNPDILSFDQIIDSDLKINETKKELMKKDENGKDVSYNPKRYEYSYNFFVNLALNSPWFNTVSIKVNNSSIDGYDNDEYEEAYLNSEAISEVLAILKDGGDREELDNTINYYKDLLATPRHVYDKNYHYYQNDRSYSKGRDYYVSRDPRRNHFRF